MANPLYGSENFSTTLNVGGGINNTQTTGIILTSVSGLSSTGGILGFTWASTIDTSTYEEMEYGGYTGNELTGIVRGVAGTTARSHLNQAAVVAVISKLHNDRLADKLTSRDATAIQDPNANEILKSAYVASAVNEVTISNAATGNAPEIAATGADTDVSLRLTPKGAGIVTTNGAENYAADAGSNDTYVITVGTLAAYKTGQVFKFKANTANTGAATLNVNSLGAKTIVKNYNVTLADNDIKANQLVEVIYDGTNFQLLSPVSNSAGGSLMSTYSGSGSSTTSASLSNITGATVSVTTTVTSHIALYAHVAAFSASATDYYIRWHNGTSSLGQQHREDLRTGNARSHMGAIAGEASKAPGTYTYTLQHLVGGGVSASAETVDLLLLAIPA